jgi:hypothetical protein
MPDRIPVLSPKKQFYYNIGVCRRAAKIFWMGLTGCARALIQMCMANASNDRLWQMVCAFCALCLAMFGWYANRLSNEVAKANEGITTVSIQVACVQTRVDGIEKRLDALTSVEPLKSDVMLAVTR